MYPSQAENLSTLLQHQFYWVNTHYHPINSTEALKNIHTKNCRKNNVADRIKAVKTEHECKCDTALRRPKRTSVCIVRSWASSSIMTAYCVRSGSMRHSRSNIPSVMYLITVSELVQSSNRIVYPTWQHKHHSLYFQYLLHAPRAVHPRREINEILRGE